MKKIKLETQLHVAREGTLNLDLSQIKPVVNQEGLAKPKYGLWTSTLINKEVGSNFFIDFPMRGDWCLIEPLEANIFIVKTDSDVKQLLLKYGRENPLGDTTFIDFQKLSTDYDALHLTESCFTEGSPVKKLNINEQIFDIHSCNYHPFHQWLSESTLWFKSNFKSINVINK